MGNMAGMEVSRAAGLSEENGRRLDKASESIVKMHGLVNDLKKQISELSSDRVMAQPDTSQLSDDLGELGDKYESIIASQLLARQQIVDEKLTVDDCEEVVKDMYNNELLSVAFEAGDDGKPRYKNDVGRNAATKKNLSASDAYNAAKLALKQAKSAAGKTSAAISMNEDLLKEYGRRNAALISRLDNATAQINALGGA